jgi:hypothetical protein
MMYRLDFNYLCVSTEIVQIKTNNVILNSMWFNPFPYHTWSSLLWIELHIENKHTILNHRM